VFRHHAQRPRARARRRDRQGRLDQVYGDVRAGESATVAPLIVKEHGDRGKLRRGSSGVRGHADAFKLEKRRARLALLHGAQARRAGVGDLARRRRGWQRGGGNCWTTPTFDADLNRLYFNTGNPCPDFDGAVREGDNLFTDSVVAVDPDSGKILDHYQYTPHDVWDYDSTMENIRSTSTGRSCPRTSTRTGTVHPRSTDCSLVRVVAFVDRITWGEIDANGK